MRILYIDIDTLRADHSGCYGYHRTTSPNIDALAAEGVRFDTLLRLGRAVPAEPHARWLSGRFGIQNGVVEPRRHRRRTLSSTAPSAGSRRSSAHELRRRCCSKPGLRTVTSSSFAERHSAFHWHAGFTRRATVGKRRARERRRGAARSRPIGSRATAASDDWFLHVQLWDPHTPYRAPAALRRAVRRRAAAGVADRGGARRTLGGLRPALGPGDASASRPTTRTATFPRQPRQIAD